MTEEQVRQKINIAAEGRHIWLELEKEQAFDENTFVILFPESGTMCNKYVMKYLAAFMGKTGTDRVLLLSHDEEVLNAGSDADMKIQTRFLSREDAVKIIAYYMLQVFTDKLIIASLDEPEGRNGSNIIGINGITLEETVATGILGLS